MPTVSGGVLSAATKGQSLNTAGKLPTTSNSKALALSASDSDNENFQLTSHTYKIANSSTNTPKKGQTSAHITSAVEGSPFKAFKPTNAEAG